MLENDIIANFMDHYFKKGGFNKKKRDDDPNTLKSLVNDSSIEDKDFDDVLFAIAQLNDWKNFDRDKAWENLDRNVLGRSRISLLKYVSAAVLLIGVTVAIYVFSGVGDEISFVAGRQNKHVVLPDGSDVVLAPHSELIISSGFNNLNRELSLKGNGYFNVVKNKKLSFVVELEKGEVEVLGTTFYIKQDKEELDVKLVSGVLKVTDENANSEIINSRQEARVDEGIQIQSNKSFEEIDLQFDDLVLKEVSLLEAVQKINTVYNKKIIKIAEDSDGLGKEMIYMTVKNSSAIDFLRGLKMIFSIKVTNVNGHYVISNENVK